jgi:hypothetical protein
MTKWNFLNAAQVNPTFEEEEAQEANEIRRRDRQHQAQMAGTVMYGNEVHNNSDGEEDVVRSQPTLSCSFPDILYFNSLTSQNVSLLKQKPPISISFSGQRSLTMECNGRPHSPSRLSTATVKTAATGLRSL